MLSCKDYRLFQSGATSFIFSAGPNFISVDGYDFEFGDLYFNVLTDDNATLKVARSESGVTGVTSTRGRRGFWACNLFMNSQDVENEEQHFGNEN